MSKLATRFTILAATVNNVYSRSADNAAPRDKSASGTNIALLQVKNSNV